MTEKCTLKSDNSIFSYKGYTASMVVCRSNELVFLNIDNTDVQLSANNLPELKEEFIKFVEHSK